MSSNRIFLFSSPSCVLHLKMVDQGDLQAKRWKYLEKVSSRFCQQGKDLAVGQLHNILIATMTWTPSDRSSVLPTSQLRAFACVSSVVASTCLKKNEVLRSDQGAAALKAVMPILTLVYRHFDQKTHQASVEHIKQIMTLLLRKLEVFVEQPGDLSVQSTNVQVLLAVKTIQKGLVLFPNCFSQAI